MPCIYHLKPTSDEHAASEQHARHQPGESGDMQCAFPGHCGSACSDLVSGEPSEGKPAVFNSTEHQMAGFEHRPLGRGAHAAAAALAAALCSLCICSCAFTCFVLAFALERNVTGDFCT